MSWCKNTTQYVVQIAHYFKCCRPFNMVDPLCVSTVCEVLTLNSPPVTHVTHVAERRLADRLAKAVSYEITDEIATSGVLQIPSRFLSATCWCCINSVKRAFPHTWQTQETFLDFCIILRIYLGKLMTTYRPSARLWNWRWQLYYYYYYYHYYY